MRFAELDLLRGLAVIMMIVYHFVFDLHHFAGFDIDPNKSFWLVIARTTALIFILLVGIGLSISHSKVAISQPPYLILQKNILRGLKIIIIGMGITLVTYFYLDNKGTIWFGILHFIGLSIILTYPFLKLRKALPPIALAIIIIGFSIRDTVTNVPLLLIFGITTPHFYSLDYFPLFPWFGVMLLGVFLGNTLYKNANRTFKFERSEKTITKSLTAKKLALLGRHSLIVYLIHQPILIGLINIFWLT